MDESAAPPSQASGALYCADLTARQRQVLDLIVSSIRARGFPPTLREIGVVLKIRSTNGVSDHLNALARKGYLTREATRSRGCALTPRAAALLGDTVTFGTPAPGAVPLATPDACAALIEAERARLYAAIRAEALRYRTQAGEESARGMRMQAYTTTLRAETLDALLTHLNAPEIAPPHPTP